MKLLSGNESGHDGILPPEGAAGFCQLRIRQSVQVGGPALGLKETLSVRGEGSDGGGLRNDRKAGSFPHPAQQCPAGLVSGQDSQVRDGGGQLGGGAVLMVLYSIESAIRNFQLFQGKIQVNNEEGEK